MDVVIARRDIDQKAFDRLLKESLAEDLSYIEGDDCSLDLIEAFNRVIAYYSVPSDWKNGSYDEE